MRPVLEHLNAINELLPALHDGFVVESYDRNKEQLVILGSRDMSYHRDLVIVCRSPVEVRFVDAFTADAIRLSKHQSGQDVLELLDDGNVALSVRGGVFEFDCDHI
jgi:hypothetical protein